MRKILKGIVCFVALFVAGLGMASCDNDETPNNNNNDSTNENGGNNNESYGTNQEAEVRKKEIYQLAVNSGFTGTYEEWLESIRGDKVELSIANNSIVWKYTEEDNWKVLISLDELKGDKGDKGDNGLSAYEIYLKYYPEYTGSEKEWIDELINGTLNKIRYEVKFYDGTTLLSTQRVVEGTNIVQPGNPIKDNYELLGWYDEDDNLWDFDTVIEDNVNLYAKWVLTIESDPTALDIHINYNGISGVSYNSTESYYNPIEKLTYVRGDLLPTWKTFGENLNLTIREASRYYANSNRPAENYAMVYENGFKSETDPNQDIDLFYNQVNYTQQMGLGGYAIDLSDYLDKMPNLSAFLEANPTIKKQITSTNGGIYYTPYFDGYNNYERSFIMDTQITEKILDVTDFYEFDTTTVNGGTNPSSNVVQSPYYEPYTGQYNYRESDVNGSGKVEVLVLDSTGAVTTMEVNVVDNIISQQNALLKNGCTGKALAEQFKAYLQSVYYDNVGEGKIYSKYSEIFTSASAAYTTDELIALMRVVKANPGYITGDSNEEVETFFIRGQANNRVDNVADLLQLWGVQGMTSEKDMLYFAADGTLRDAATNSATYEGLKNVAAMYQEGLILNLFWNKPAQSYNSAYLDKYFKKTVQDSGYGFITYDYSAPVCAANDKVDGIGTDPSTRKINYETKGIMPILPPLAYWETGVDNDGDFTKELIRHYEENATLKTMSWCIPSNTDNLMGALKMMDYMYSEEGSRIQDFGPTDYWTLGTIGGEESPVFTEEFKEMFVGAGMDIFSFMRNYIGSTQSVGSVRSKTFLIQCSNVYGQEGINNLNRAISAGVVNVSLVDKTIGQYTWDTSVPITITPAISYDELSMYSSITAFWASTKCKEEATGWVYYVANYYTEAFDVDVILGNDDFGKNYTFASVLSEIDQKNQIYLYRYASSLGDECIPDFARP